MSFDDDNKVTSLDDWATSEDELGSTETNVDLPRAEVFGRRTVRPPDGSAGQPTTSRDTSSRGR